MISGTLPQLQILAMSRTSPERNAYVFSELAKCKNLSFVQYDCAKEYTVPYSELQNCLSVVHLVGGLRTNHVMTRMFKSVSDQMRESRVKSRKRQQTKVSSQQLQLEALMHLFTISS